MESQLQAVIDECGFAVEQDAVTAYRIDNITRAKTDLTNADAELWATVCERTA
jgi:hypothetical protein